MIITFLFSHPSFLDFFKMLRQLKLFTRRLIAGANVATIVVMLLLGYSGVVSPVSHPKACVLSLLFPALIWVNVAFLVFWAVFYRRYILIPLAGFLLAWGPLRTYVPVNLPHKTPEGSIKVLSFNIWNFATHKAPKDKPNPIMEYILNSGADIVCLQEYSPHEAKKLKIDSLVRPVYPYIDTVRAKRSTNVNAIFSKYPIVGKEHAYTLQWSTVTGVFKVLIDGDTVAVVNCHLETNSLSYAEKKEFKHMIKGEMGKDTMRTTSLKLIDKLAIAAVKRAPQAEAVAQYIKEHKGQSMIVCGDFNDNPLSYVYRTIADGLTDCYVSTANGPGWSFHASNIYVRIDNILCTSDWEPYNCKVDRKITLSDHYSIYCWLKKRTKH